MTPPKKPDFCVAEVDLDGKPTRLTIRAAKPAADDAVAVEVGGRRFSLKVERLAGYEIKRALGRMFGGEVGNVDGQPTIMDTYRF